MRKTGKLKQPEFQRGDTVRVKGTDSIGVVERLNKKPYGRTGERRYLVRFYIERFRFVRIGKLPKYIKVSYPESELKKATS